MKSIILIRALYFTVAASILLGRAEADTVAISDTKTERLPAKLNANVAAMKANSWIRLPTQSDRPISRSSSPWMPYVPEAGVAILWGCSHVGHHNDVWTYDLSQNAWTEMLATEPSAAVDQGVLKYKDGLLMTRLERPLAAHQWGRMDYDSDRKVLWHMGGFWQGIYDVPATYKKFGWKFNEEGNPQKHQERLKKGPVLWKYSLKTNRWDHIYTEDSTATPRVKGGMRYFPPLRRLVMTPSIVEPNGNREQFKTYDPATNKWESLDVVWKPMDEGISRYWGYGHSPIVYDSKLKALVLIFSDGGTWLLDPIAKTMRQVVAKDISPPANLDGPVGSYVYDSSSGKTLGIFADLLAYEPQPALKKRGFPTDRAFVLALDIEKNKWTIQPSPADGILPPVDNMRTVHHYYDPINNATVIYRGPYNGLATETWVYRYKVSDK